MHTVNEEAASIIQLHACILKNLIEIESSAGGKKNLVAISVPHHILNGECCQRRNEVEELKRWFGSGSFGGGDGSAAGW